MATQLMIGPEEQVEDYSFRVGLLIKHPRRDLSDLADLLDIDPHFHRVAGEERRTPTGRAIDGIYLESTWSSYRFRTGKDFVAAIDELIEHLLDHRRVFEEIAETGGSSQMSIHLPGGENVGLVLSSTSAGKLAAMKMDLGVEVFPG